MTGSRGIPQLLLVFVPPVFFFKKSCDIMHKDSMFKGDILMTNDHTHSLGNQI
jgi:hypothetical protein